MVHKTMRKSQERILGNFIKQLRGIHTQANYLFFRRKTFAFLNPMI